MPRPFRWLRPGLGALLAAASVALAASGGCAYNTQAENPQGRQTLIFEYSVEGDRLTQANNLAYYFVVNTDPGADQQSAPLVNGPAPNTYPYPDPRSYLPFVREDATNTQALDRQPGQPIFPATNWTDFFALYDVAGEFQMWQGRKITNPDGTYRVNEKYRQLQNGREWGIRDGRTVQLTIPFNQLSTPAPQANGSPAPLPSQFNCNLAVATRGEGGAGRGFMIERWGRVQNTFFPVLTREINQNLYDTVSGVTFPENLGGIDPKTCNLVSITYRVTSGQ
jgi:hypothetical protein